MPRRFHYLPALIAVALFAFGCVVHTHGVKNKDAGDGDSTSPAMPLPNLNADKKAPEAEADNDAKSPSHSSAIESPKAVGQTLTEDTEGLESGGRTCIIPKGFSASNHGPAMPQIVAGKAIVTQNARALIKLLEDGRAEIHFDVELENRGKGAEKAGVGFMWRTSTSGKAAALAGDLKYEGISSKVCTLESDKKIHKPFTDVINYVELEIPAGDSSRVKGKYTVNLRKEDKPATLFGFNDRFGNNWKNWEWPYIHASHYASIKDKLHPFYGAFATTHADSTVIEIQSANKNDWMRAMSFEQSTEKMRAKGLYRWKFEADDLPTRVEFEYVTSLSIESEITVFKKIVKDRADDLRARIHLSDLYRYAGDTAERAKLLEDLLRIWDKNTKKQMIINRNDVRAGAYVGLVSSLLSLGKKQEARRFADKGIKEIEKLDTNLDMNKMALGWLKKITAD